MATDNAQARQILENLRQGFIRHIPQRLAAIEQCWIDCYLNADPAPALHELMRLVHSLRGTAKTFGLMQLGDAAGLLETGLSPWVTQDQLPTQESRAHLDELVALLHTASREVIETTGGLSSIPAQESKDKAALVYLLEDEPEQAALLTTQLEYFGYRTIAFATPQDLLESLDRERPAVCILDIVVAGNEQAGIDLGLQLHRRDASLPLIFLSIRDDIAARLGAVRAGGLAYLSKPVNIGHMIEAMDKVTGRRTDPPYRILIVEDDASLARYYQALLQDGGMEALVVTEPLKVLRTVDDFNPDLVLMDIYMPQCTGAELAQVIRQHGSLGSLPIVYLSAEDDPDVQYAAMRIGGDDFLTKPVDPAVLLRTVTTRAQRARQLGALMVRDSLTNLLNHGRIKEMLIAEVARARRGNTTLAVAMLDLDHFKSINDQYGHMTGDRVLKSLARLLDARLRDGDWAGRFGGEEFLLILPNCDYQFASGLVDDIRVRFASVVHHGKSPDQAFTATVSAGLATFPPAVNAEELLSKVEEQLYQAKHQGRNCTR